MENDRIITSQLKAKIRKFTSRAKDRLSKPTGKFFEQMMYGILGSKSVILVQIAKQLKEKAVLQSTVNRLSRNLEQADITEAEKLYRREAAKAITEDSIIAYDFGDLSKGEHAKHFEHLDRVRNGDTGKINPGYHLVGAVGSNLEERTMTPLYMSLHSTKEVGYKSENKELAKAFDAVLEATEGKGIDAIDRGGDAQTIFEMLFARGRSFIVRMTSQRHLIDRKGKKRGIMSIAQGCKCRLGTLLKKGKKRTRKYHVGITRVHLPFEEEKELTLIVLKGADRTVRMLLLTTKLFEGKEGAIKVIKGYFKRWQIEEYYRLIKQNYDFENVRILEYKALQTMTKLVFIVSGFLSQLTRSGIKLILELYKKARRTGKIPNYGYYALIDGIHEILNKSSVGIERIIRQLAHPRQLLLPELTLVR